MTTTTTTRHRVSRTTTMLTNLLLVSLGAAGSDAYLSTTTQLRPALVRPTTSGPLHLVKPSAVSNEWGIPYSSDLPPLVDRIKGLRPIPNALPNGGRVTLVGSGPGDPNLLTVSAYKLLTETTGTGGNTIVIADRLVSPEILNIISPDTVIKVARKLPGCAELAQEEIYWWMYQALNQGKHVIRLKIGDPFIFGRGGEEVLTCRRFGVEPIVIPVRVYKVLSLSRAAGR
jgi:Tetrapyrrole (Corrin/Porphyrin) Methylases